jgi:hypothetical protein
MKPKKNPLEAEFKRIIAGYCQLMQDLRPANNPTAKKIKAVRAKEKKLNKRLAAARKKIRG